MTLDEILEVGLPLIKRWEGLRLRPYLCSAGVATIGYGSTYYEDGRRVTLKDSPIDSDQAQVLLINTVKTQYLPAVLSLCPTLSSPNQVAAILSWVYNLGVGALKSSTLRKKILKENWEEAAKEILKWDKAGGRKLPGLARRREAEAKLFLSDRD